MSKDAESAVRKEFQELKTMFDNHKMNMLMDESWNSRINVASADTDPSGDYTKKLKEELQRLTREQYVMMDTHKSNQNKIRELQNQEKFITTKMIEYKTKLDMKIRELEDLKSKLEFEENETEQLRKQLSKKAELVIQKPPQILKTPEPVFKTPEPVFETPEPVVNTPEPVILVTEHTIVITEHTIKFEKTPEMNMLAPEVEIELLPEVEIESSPKSEIEQLPEVEIEPDFESDFEDSASESEEPVKNNRLEITSGYEAESELTVKIAAVNEPEEVPIVDVKTKPSGGISSWGKKRGANFDMFRGIKPDVLVKTEDNFSDVNLNISGK